ncbi:DDE-type integrase/transposase/recombinase [Rhodococcus sp. KBS0724]|uniref:DDE-type integrase/transposase/recombinase n=1 Tax=Rhodococcus sp. KBS0724 TaxID=1179674 RepID=UPI00110EF6C5|nr:DDE-type integrase/transposase/recombinase [Rhodococcus sp. KBS0724]
MARLGHPCRAPECFTGSLVITSVATIAGIQAREGKIYCAVVLDTFSRRVVGWSIDSSQTATLVTNALGMAISNRGPTPGTLIHSDRGVQFTSWAFTRRAHDSGLVPSTGSIGDCYDCQSVPAGLCA